MSIFTFQKFNHSLKKNNVIYPIYVFLGEDSYLINLALKQLEQVLCVDNLDREVFCLQYTSTSILDILNSIKTYPLYGNTREIIVKYIDKMTSNDSDYLTKYLDNIIKTSCLILVYYNNYKNDTSIKRQEFINKCINSQKCMVINCQMLLYNELKEFIQDEFTKRNKRISKEALSLISKKIGKNLANISNEVEKLTLLLGDETNIINSDDCYKFFKNMYNPNTNLSILYSSLIEKKLSVALFTIEQLFIDNQEPILILYTIASSIRKIIYAKSMLDEQNISSINIARKLNIKQYNINTFFKKLQQHNMNQLKNSFHMLLKLDIAIKTIHNDSYIKTLMNEIIIFICQ
jgi:DNA polymerase-3 subunit delta